MRRGGAPRWFLTSKRGGGGDRGCAVASLGGGGGTCRTHLVVHEVNEAGGIAEEGDRADC